MTKSLFNLIKENKANTIEPAKPKAFDTSMFKAKPKVAIGGTNDGTKLNNKPSRDLLFGTGLTKKVAIGANKAHKAEEIASNIEPDLNSKIKTGIANFTAAKLQSMEHAEIAQPPVLSMAVEPSIIYDESQLSAIEGLVTQKYGCLIGAAGTGKTTVTKELVSRLEDTLETIDLNSARTSGAQTSKPDYAPAISFSAFTGRAVQQMKRALPHDYHKNAATMHA